MKTLDLFGYSVEIDLEATRTWYAAAQPWGCECGHCRNFLALARARRLPAFVLDTLDRLGIPPEKATYVGELGPAEGGRLYQFSCRLAGNILREPPQPSGEGFCWHDPYPYGAPGFPTPHFDLGFATALPWILEEPQ